MEKVADWNGVTQSHGFSVEGFHDATSKMFTALIHTSSPSLMPQHIPRFADPNDEVR
jgi:hypothetical protein